MAIEPNNDIIEPEDSDNTAPPAPESNTEALDATAAPIAGDAEIPVPVAMEPAEIDERAQVIEALNRSAELP